MQNKAEEFCLSGRFFSVFLPQATLSLACGYENSAFQAVSPVIRIIMM